MLKNILSIIPFLCIRYSTSARRSTSLNTNTSRSTRMSTSTSTNMSTRTRSSSMRLSRRFLDLLINLCESHDLFPPLFPHPPLGLGKGGGGGCIGGHSEWGTKKWPCSCVVTCATLNQNGIEQFLGHSFLCRNHL
jgi:hypothetical protein